MTLVPKLSLPGVVRVSLGIENTTEDFDALIHVLGEITRQPPAGADNPFASVETNVINFTLFILVTILLVFISRKSLLHPRTHGFYRFFAWEILLVMLLNNINNWFRNPLTWYQIISWIMLVVSLLLVIIGVRLLHEIGRHEAKRDDPALLGLEKTSKLVTVGLYRYIRHPLYSSLLFLGWGVFFKSPSWLDAVLAMLCIVFLIATARVEECENIRYFGDEYKEYIRQSKMFIPFIL
jgi:protein-S-isoprenylcysteine O-methyltransferase Ste14